PGPEPENRATARGAICRRRNPEVLLPRDQRPARSAGPEAVELPGHWWRNPNPVRAWGGEPAVRRRHRPAARLRNPDRGHRQRAEDHPAGRGLDDEPPRRG